MSQNFGAAQQQQDQATPQTLPVLPIKESHQLLKDNGKSGYFRSVNVAIQPVCSEELSRPIFTEIALN